MVLNGAQRLVRAHLVRSPRIQTIAKNLSSLERRDSRYFWAYAIGAHEKTDLTYRCRHDLQFLRPRDKKGVFIVPQNRLLMRVNEFAVFYDDLSNNAVRFRLAPDVDSRYNNDAQFFGCCLQTADELAIEIIACFPGRLSGLEVAAAIGI